MNCGAHYPLTVADKIRNKFWKDTLYAYGYLCKAHNTEHKEYYNYPIFYNKKILIGTQSVF